MNSFPLVISFYTKNTLYQLEIQNLIASCDKWGVERDIEGIDSFGSWELNCAYKPFFILQKMQQHQRPLLWVDADGVFSRAPDVLEIFSADFAVRINEECPLDHPSRVVSSTIYANYTPAAFMLVRNWARECSRQLLAPGRKGEFWDQTALRDAIFSVPHEAAVKAMPLAYAKIFDHAGDIAKVKNPVIEHYQASRRFKNSVNAQ